MFRMFTGDPGPQGLPGLYTMQIPHRVQKRDTGNEVIGRYKKHRRRAIGG